MTNGGRENSIYQKQNLFCLSQYPRLTFLILLLIILQIYALLSMKKAFSFAVCFIKINKIIFGSIIGFRKISRQTIFSTFLRNQFCTIKYIHSKYKPLLIKAFPGKVLASRRVPIVYFRLFNSRIQGNAVVILLLILMEK